MIYDHCRKWNGRSDSVADPVAKRSELYILHESMIEATLRPDGTFSQEIYLDGNRLVDKARIAGNVSDEDILELLKSSSGFRKLVHSVGISVQIFIILPMRDMGLWPIA